MNDEDVSAIKLVVKLYGEGLHEGDADKLAQAFHPSARIQGYIGDTGASLSRDDFVRAVVKLGSRQAAGETLDLQIAAIDQAGRAALAKVTLRWNGHAFTDYLALLKRDGGWSISEKTYYAPG